MSIEYNNNQNSQLDHQDFEPPTPPLNNHILIVNELERLIDRDPQEVLTPLLSVFFKRIENQNVAFPEEILQTALETFNTGDVLGSFEILTQKFSDKPIISTLSRRVREEEKRLAALLSKSNTVAKGLSPETFKLGTRSHHLAETIECFGFDSLQKLRPKGLIVELEIRKEKVVGLNLKSEIGSQESLLSSDKKKPASSENTPKTGKIIFPEHLPAPQEDETEEEWALRIIRDSRNILGKLHCIPEKPHDVSLVFQGQETKTALLKLTEISYFIFGNELLWKDEEIGNGGNTVSLEYPDEFAILNLLSIIRLIDESENNFPLRTENDSIAKELALGDLQINIPNGNLEGKNLRIKGGVLDLVNFKWNGTETKRGLNFSQLMGYVEDEVKCQRAKYTRVHLDHPEKISQRALLRNLKSEFRVLYHIYGEELFTSLDLTIDDLKFPAGDGGWWTVFNSEDLPDIKHKNKMDEYLLFAVAQLCWVKKLSLINQNISWGKKENEKEDIVLNVEEIVNFVLEYNLPQRFNGKIRYQLPTQEIDIEVRIPETREELQKWIVDILHIKDKLANQEEKKLAILRTLKILIPQERIEGLQFVLREQKKLPEELEVFCCEVKGQFYLVIDEFRNFLERNGNYVLRNAVFYKEYGVWIINLKNFVEGNKNLRIAVNEKGKFTILGLEEGSLVRGELLTSREMRGVRERTDIKFNHFKTLISDFLLENSVLEGIDMGIILENGTVMDSYGDFRKIIEGKPLVCRMDLMTGQWFLDKNLLQEAVGSLGGKRNFGFDKIFNYAFGGIPPHGNIFCPLPWHNNIESEAAAFYRNQNDKHIHCFVCREQIEIKTGRGIVNFEAPYKTTEGLDPTDYKPVTLNRGRIFGEIIRIGNEFVEADENPRNYIASRGLEVSDLGKFGYIPPALSSFLFDLVDSQTYSELIKKGKSRFLTLEAICSFQGIESWKLDTFLQNLSSELRDDVSRTFSLGNLREMFLRGIVSGRKRKSGIAGDDTLGGRILFPTYWISSSANQLAISNWIGRGVELGGVTLYEGVKQHKIRLGKQKKEKDIRKIVYPTPTGIWFRDKEFATSARELIIVESPLNGGSLGRILPNYSRNCLAVAGTGHRELIAFLKWVRFGTDDRRTIYLAHDYDKGGVDTFLRTKEKLEENFPDINILPINEILPDDVRSMIPPYDWELFNINKESGIPGPLLGLSLDLNEILTIPGLGRKYAYQGLEKETEKTTKFLEAMKNLT